MLKFATESTQSSVILYPWHKVRPTLCLQSSHKNKQTPENGHQQCQLYSASYTMRICSHETDATMMARASTASGMGLLSQPIWRCQQPNLCWSVTLGANHISHQCWLVAETYRAQHVVVLCNGSTIYIEVWRHLYCCKYVFLKPNLANMLT